MRVADWIIKRLADVGVKHVFLLPGGGAMHLNDALRCETRIQAIACHHEQACGIAAESYGRADFDRNPGFGVAMVTTGPGATNVITAVAGAWLDSIPMFILSGQVKSADRLNGRPIRQGGVQEVDIVPIVQSITKYAVTINSVQGLRDCVDHALFLMKSGRPGPVWIDVPLDIQGAMLNSEQLEFWSERNVFNGQQANRISAEQYDRVFDLIKNSQRPLIVAGHGVRVSNAAEVFRHLVETFQIPAVLTWNGLDLLPYDHPMNIGRPGVVATRAANFAVQNCDLLISIGARLDNIVTGYNRKGFARSAKKIIVDVDPCEINDKVEMGFDIAIESDAKEFMLRLLETPLSLDVSAWRNRCLDWKKRFTQNEGVVFPKTGPISHAHFVDAISDAIPENTLIATGSSGLAIEFLYAGFRNKQGQRIYLTSGLGSMGYGLPSAIGACFGRNCEPIVAIESDGSLQLNLQEIATIVANKLPICIFVMNNNGYASIRNTQRNYFQSRYIASGPDSGLYIPELSKIASAYGLPCVTIEKCDNLNIFIREVLSLPRPLFVDIHLLADEALLPKCSAIPQANGAMISMPLEDMSPLLSFEELEREMIVGVHDASRKARGR